MEAIRGHTHTGHSSLSCVSTLLAIPISMMSCIHARSIRIYVCRARV